jgi:hypothetical protein
MADSDPIAAEQAALDCMRKLRASMRADIEASILRLAGIDQAIALLSGQPPRRCDTNLTAGDGSCLACDADQGERCRLAIKK